MTTNPDPLPLPSTEGRGRLAVRVTCKRCGRPLHDPESRLLRLGPECRQSDQHTRRRQVEQDTLPGL